MKVGDIVTIKAEADLLKTFFGYDKRGKEGFTYDDSGQYYIRFVRSMFELCGDKVKIVKIRENGRFVIEDKNNNIWTLLKDWTVEYGSSNEYDSQNVVNMLEGLL